ncbi:hypothetical protein L7F22_021478 [Adiantum nelumboides]|nr:hypothetical protein [Adiantum nelumboides]
MRYSPSMMVSWWFLLLHTLSLVGLLCPCAAQGKMMDSIKNCSRLSPLVGFTGQLSMLQHQLRGQIVVSDDCSFSVTKFDMILGKEVYWWGAKGDDYENLTSGFAISALQLNKTFSNASMVVTLNNCTWGDFDVLGVWDTALEADYGHVLLSNAEMNLAMAPSMSPASAPGPALAPFSEVPNESTGRGIYWGGKEPTMFDNCKVLNDIYRLRWSLNVDRGTVDLGLEAAVPDTHYMAFGWAKPESTSSFMLHADVVLAGFRNHTAPFVEDYFINKYSECTWGQDGPSGVCPDSVYPGNDEDKSDGELKFLHGQWQDGVAFIRYQKSLQSFDKRFDVPINATGEMVVIWALGLIKKPDSFRPLHLPEKHTSFGHLKLNLSDAVNECTGPLQARGLDDLDMIVAEAGVPIVVGVGPATHYPNPPNFDKVLYLNKVEAPVLKVERGVQVTFSVQAGHDVAFYISENPVGGEPKANSTLFAGGPDAHGVPATPFPLAWKPDRFTPDEVYYQSYFQKKMGWKIRVVDGGLTDMYNSSAFLADQKVMLYWMLTEVGISFAVRSVPKSGYIAIGFGETMVNTFAYVGWLENDTCKVGTYWIDGRDSGSIHRTRENLTDVQCAQLNGMLTFQFSRPLDPHCTDRQECRNVIDPSIPLKVVWALGTHWKADQLTDSNMHSSKSSKYMSVYLTRGVAEAEQELRPVLAVHGFIMFLAWALLFPGGVLAARYLRHLKDDGWFQIHVYSQYSGLAIMFLGVLFAVAELREFRTGSLHVKLGLTSIVIACAQPINAFFRPKKAASGEQQSSRRLAWQLVHKYIGGATLIVGFVTLLTGIVALSNEYGGDQTRGLGWALVVWLFCIVVLIIYLEYRRFRLGKFGRETSFTKGTWVMANNDDDDSANLLRSSRPSSTTSSQGEVQLYPAKRMEVQLQAL